MRLEELSRLLYPELRRAGLSENESLALCSAIHDGTKLQINNLTQYQVAWLVTDAAEQALVVEDEHSEARRWQEELVDAVSSFEEAHYTLHGYYPLNACSSEWMGPVGRA